MTSRGLGRVATVNLESGQPTVEQALQRMRNALLTYKRQGVKAVVVIHGYGSSGVGGAIRAAVQGTLQEHDMQGLVRRFIVGDDFVGVKRRDLIAMCKALGEERGLEGNAGVTIVILR